MKQAFAIILSLFLCFNLSAQYVDAIMKAQHLADSILATNNLPGLSIAVSVKGELVWAQGFGYADIDKKIPVNPYQTKFRIGSVSKPLTATALGLLLEEGKLDLKDDVRKHVSYFPEKKYPITIEQVAGHLSGIRHYRGTEFMSNKRYKTVRAGMDIFMNDSLLFKPGSRYSYSSYGWNLISAVVEGASDEPFLKYMKKEVFIPLGMKNTVPDWANKKIKYRTTYYNLFGSKLVVAPKVDNSYKWAGGGFLSTAEDLVKFANAHLYHTILKEETVNTLWATRYIDYGTPTNYGIGWSSNYDEDDINWVGHSGGSVGGSSMMLLYPEQEVVVVVLCNLSQARFSNLPFKIAKLFH